MPKLASDNFVDRLIGCDESLHRLHLESKHLCSESKTRAKKWFDTYKKEMLNSIKNIEKQLE